MSPVARPSRTLVPLLILSFLVAFAPMVGAQDDAAAADFSVPGDAPQPAAGAVVRVLTIGVVEEGTCADGQAAPCWDVSTVAANPGDVVVLVANMVNSANFHNLHLTTGEAVPAADGPKTQTSANGFHKVALQMPESGELSFLCDVHPQTMIGKVVTPAEAAAAGGHAESVPSLGVNFLAYWVGVIAFALLFIVYGATFFLFKYNETNATTDHWDRSEAGSKPTRLGSVASLLAVVIAVAAIAAVIFLATRLGR